MPRLSVRADVGIGAIAASPTGRDAVLAGRSGLYIVDLHDPLALPRWLPLRSAWEVASVQWCPHPNRPGCLVSTSNQKALVWNLALPSEKAVEHVLHGHRRAVTSIEFSSLSPDQFATASIDTTVRLWDLRHIEASVMTFADFNAGMMQVQWDPTNENRLATAQAERVSVWDKRMSNRSVYAFSAHSSECNGLEFFANGKMITCSTDRTVKVWDLKQAGTQPEPEIVLNAGFPVWRALPTPFEYGAFVVPLRGGRNRVSLVNLAGLAGKSDFDAAKVGSYEHPNVVKSAVYLHTNTSSSKYDLMTWCHDSELREWKGDMLLRLPHASLGTRCKDNIPEPLENTGSFNTDEFDLRFHSLHGAGREMFDLPILDRHRNTQTLSQFDWVAGVRISKTHYKEGISSVPVIGTNAAETFSQEIISVSSKFPRALFEDINIGTRTCSLSLFGPWGSEANYSVVNLRLDVRVPIGYPNEPLKFALHPDLPYVSKDQYREISEFLDASTRTLSEHSLHALEFCVRYLVGDPVSIEDQLTRSGESAPLIAFPVVETLSDDDLDNDLDGDLDNDLDDDLDDDLDGTSLGNSAPLSALEIRNPNTSDQRTDDSGVIDSTPLPKSCGGVWSVTGQLICFFNHKPVKRERGPLPLDKVFADDSDDSNEPFVSDGDDFELRNPSSVTASWSVAAAQLQTGTNKPGSVPKRSRTRTVTTITSEDTGLTPSTSSHKVVVHDLVHMWPCRPDVARAYELKRLGPALVMAKHNVTVASQFGLHLHEYVWRLLVDYVSHERQSFSDKLYLMTSSPLKYEWEGASVGFGALLPKLSEYLEARGELQLLACISMVLSALRAERYAVKEKALREYGKQFAEMPIMESETETHFYATNGNITMLNEPPQRDTNPPPDANDGMYFSFEINDSALFEFSYPLTPNGIYAKPRTEEKGFVAWLPRVNSYHMQYASLLHTWGLSLQQAEVAKPNTLDPLMSKISFNSACEPQKARIEAEDDTFCAFCYRPMTGLFKLCGQCSHGMHTECAQQWWTHDIECPAACGCICDDRVERVERAEFESVK